MANKKKYTLEKTTSISGKGNLIFRHGGPSFTADQLPEGTFEQYFKMGFLKEVKEVKVTETAEAKEARLAKEVKELKEAKEVTDALMVRLEPLTTFEAIKAEFTYPEVKNLFKHLELSAEGKSEEALVNAILATKTAE